MLYCGRCSPTVNYPPDARRNEYLKPFGVESWETFFTALILENHYEPHGNSIVGMVPGDCHGTGRALRHRPNLRPPTPKASARCSTARRSTAGTAIRNIWRVEDGCITGQTTKENPAPYNTFLIWRGGKPGDFQLKIEFRMPNPGFANSGVQIRSWEGPKKWQVIGYQPDMDSDDTLHGHLLRREFSRRPGRPRREGH